VDASAGGSGGDTSADEAAGEDVHVLRARGRMQRAQTRYDYEADVQKKRTGGLKMGRRSNFEESPVGGVPLPSPIWWKCRGIRRPAQVGPKCFFSCSRK
jgi:hypothetical protein